MVLLSKKPIHIFVLPNGEASGPSGAGRALGKSQVFGEKLWHPQNQGANAFYVITLGIWILSWWFFATPLKNMQTHIGLDHESPTFYPGENNKLMVEPTQLKICSSNWILSPQMGAKNLKIFELPPPRMENWWFGILRVTPQ